MNIQQTLSVILPWDLSIQTHLGTFAVPHPPRVADLLVLNSISGQDGIPDMSKVDVFLASVIPGSPIAQWFEEEKLEAIGIISREIAARKKKGDAIRAKTQTTSTPG